MHIEIVFENGEKSVNLSQTCNHISKLYLWQ